MKRHTRKGRGTREQIANIRWYAEIKNKKKIFGENTKVIKERTSETKMLINKASSTQRSKIKDFFG